MLLKARCVDSLMFNSENLVKTFQSPFSSFDNWLHLQMKARQIRAFKGNVSDILHPLFTKNEEMVERESPVLAERFTPRTRIRN